MNLNKNSLFQSKEKIPKKYFELIEKCCSEDPKKRPSFEKIVKQLKNKSDFIVVFKSVIIDFKAEKALSHIASLAGKDIIHKAAVEKALNEIAFPSLICGILTSSNIWDFQNAIGFSPSLKSNEST